MGGRLVRGLALLLLLVGGYTAGYRSHQLLKGITGQSRIIMTLRISRRLSTTAKDSVRGISC